MKLYQGVRVEVMSMKRFERIEYIKQETAEAVLAWRLSLVPRLFGKYVIIDIPRHLLCFHFINHVCDSERFNKTCNEKSSGCAFLMTLRNFHWTQVTKRR